MTHDFEHNNVTELQSFYGCHCTKNDVFSKEFFSKCE